MAPTKWRDPLELNASISRNFCKEMERVNFRNFYTVLAYLLSLFQRETLLGMLKTKLWPLIKNLPKPSLWGWRTFELTKTRSLNTRVFLQRGKFFPQLTNLVRINTPKAVQTESRKAFRKLPNVEQAISTLTNLKGVGTTLASGLKNKWKNSFKNNNVTSMSYIARIFLSWFLFTSFLLHYYLIFIQCVVMLLVYYLS